MDAFMIVVVAGLSAMLIMKGLELASRARSTVGNAQFIERYGLRIPDGFDVKGADDDNRFAFKLEFPRWRLANPDGTSSVPHKSNTIEWGHNLLHVSGFDISCKDPRAMYDLVVSLRNAGMPISKSPIEISRTGNGTGYLFESVSDIVSAFEEHPTDFESYCASVYEALGYDAVVTPPTNDGGYDIILTAADGKRTIVECKCFSEGNNVGRPLIQKLVGANSVVHAEHMAYVTTSDFTSGAVKYAAETNVRLVNGEELLRMAMSINGRDASASRVLTTYDLESRFSADWFGEGR